MSCLAMPVLPDFPSNNFRYGFSLSKIISMSLSGIPDKATVILSNGSMALISLNAEVRLGDTVLTAPNGLDITMADNSITSGAYLKGILFKHPLSLSSYEAPIYDSVIIGSIVIGDSGTRQIIFLNDEPFSWQDFVDTFVGFDKISQDKVLERVSAARFARLMTPPLFMPSELNREAMNTVLSKKPFGTKVKGETK